MPRPPKLSDEQRSRLATLEPALRNAVRLGDYPSAKRLTKDIQDLLRPTGHETRLMQAKNWLFEAALEAGEVDIAVAGFTGVRRKSQAGTRVYLEATALLAICHLRSGQSGTAKPLIEFVLREDKCIKSLKRRRQFRRRIAARFNEEAAISALRGTGVQAIDADQIELDAGQLVSTSTEDEILDWLGNALPPHVIRHILDIDTFSRAALPHSEMKYLPSPEDAAKKKEIGRTVFSAVKIALYRSLCDPQSEVYRAWSKEGMRVVLNRKYIGAAVAAMCLDLNIGIKAVAVAVTALIFRFGIDVYCVRYRPEGVMIGRDEKE